VNFGTGIYFEVNSQNVILYSKDEMKLRFFFKEKKRKKGRGEEEEKRGRG